MIFVAFVVLCAWIAAVFAAVFAFFKWVFRLFGKRTGTRQPQNESTA